MKFEEFLERLEGVRSAGDGKVANCPGHDDRRQSLSVGKGDGGRILINCHAECEPAHIVRVMGLEMRDLMGEEGSPSVSHNGSWGNKREVVATYSYQDAMGVDLFEAVRFEPKGFAQRRKPQSSDDPSKVKFGYVWSLDGIATVLYRLPYLERADKSEIVYVVEGEKDVHTLEEYGLLATCCPMGAGKWKRHYNHHLEGRLVCIIPDNDRAGHKHAEQVLDSVEKVAKSAAIVTLEDLPEKGDVTDWFQLGLGTPEQLREMAKVALGCNHKVATIADLKAAGASMAWVWPGWIPRGCLTALAGEGGKGKTRFLADLLRRVRTGGSWPDDTEHHIPPTSTALWVLADNNHNEIVKLTEDFGIEDAVYVNAWESDPFGGTILDSKEDLENLERRIEMVRPLFVFVDTVGGATDKNMARQEDAKTFYNPLAVLARKYNCAVIAVTHLNANGKFLGRRVIERVRSAISISHPDGAEKKRRRLEVVKTNAEHPDPLGITMGSSGNEYDGEPPELPEAEQVEVKVPKKVQDAADWLKDYIGNGVRRVTVIRDASDAKGISTGTLYRAKDVLSIIESRDASGYQTWSLPADGEEQNRSDSVAFA